MLGKVAVSGIKLRQDDARSLSSVVANCEHIGILELTNCQLNTPCLKSLADGLRGSKVQIDVLDVSFNRNLRKESLPYLHEICLRTSGLNYWQCGFRQVDLLTFDSNAKMEVGATDSEEEAIKRLFDVHRALDLSKTAVQRHSETLYRLTKTQMHVGGGISAQISGYGAGDDVEGLSRILQNVKQIRELEISESSLTGRSIEVIGKFVGQDLAVVNVFLCPKMCADAWMALGEIARNGKAASLLVTACGVTGKKLESLQLSFYPNQLTKLDLSRNEDMDEECLQILGNFVENANVQELIMAYCRLSASNMKILEKSMSKAKLKRFDVSGNTTMGLLGFVALGSIAENCSVEQLDISECDPVGDHLRSFESSLGTAKLKKLNLSRNRNIRSGNGMEAITNIIKKSYLQELFMRQCDLERDSLSLFKKTLGGAKLLRLDLGHYFMKGRTVTDNEIEVIIELLPNITEQLTLNKWEFSNTQRQRLQIALDQLPQEAPTVQLDRSIDDVLRRSAR